MERSNSQLKGRKRRIVLIVPYYRPGFRSGGPTASVEAMMAQIGHEFVWEIVTADRDEGEHSRYAGIPPDGRSTQGGVEIRYLPPGFERLVGLTRLLRRGDYDLLYLNDLFQPCWGLWPLVLHRSGRLRGRPVLVAPRNQLSAAALGLKPRKKRLFLHVARWLGLWDGVLWHATRLQERDEIVQMTNTNATVWVAPEFPNANVLGVKRGPVRPAGGPLRVVFFSRISPMKNLEVALSVLEGMPFPVHFDIAGPVDDAAYWARVQRMIRDLPGRISVRYLGAVEPAQVHSLLGAYDALLLPTRGENFGHVILEALAAGCPPIISDRTPWKDLDEKKCGWVVALEDVDGFRTAIEQLNAMPEERLNEVRAAARRYAQAYAVNPKIRVANLEMFRGAMATRTPRGWRGTASLFRGAGQRRSGVDTDGDR